MGFGGLGQAVTRTALRILRTLATGPRKPNVLRGLAVDTDDFSLAIGQLFLSGRIITTGKTSGLLITLNGRRTG